MDFNNVIILSVNEVNLPKGKSLNYFIPFPANYVNMEFSVSRHADSQPLKTRTKEGLALGISNLYRIAYFILISIIKRKDSLII